MDNEIQVKWTERSLSNALDIKEYLRIKFTKKDVLKFENLLKQFEKTVSNFPTLYPESKSQKALRRAVIHKRTTVYYVFRENIVTVIAMKDNRQLKPK